jgi:type II secretory pathway pseudopilin PulG
MRRGRRRSIRSRQGGFTYFGVIIAVLLIGMALAAAGVVARTAMQREREAQLLWVGAQYRTALTKFFNQNGGRLPQDLKELVLDESTPVPRHFIRRLYPDPITGSDKWLLLTLPGGGIYGVASSSNATPLKLKNFADIDRSFEDATCYRAWEFAVQSRRLPIPITTAASAC